MDDLLRGVESMKNYRTFLMIVLAVTASFLPTAGHAQMTLIPMDQTQTDHLKAYGLTYWMLQSPRGINVEWLLNYRGGSFLIEEADLAPNEARLRGIRHEVVSDDVARQIHQLIENENMDVVLLEKAPEIAITSVMPTISIKI